MYWSRDRPVTVVEIAELRREIGLHLRRFSTGDSDVESAELIVGELLANLARHAPGPFTAYLDWSDVRPVFTVSDTGPGFRLTDALPSPARESGRGLFIVQRLANHVHVTRNSFGGASVVAVLPIERSEMAHPVL